MPPKRRSTARKLVPPPTKPSSVTEPAGEAPLGSVVLGSSSESLIAGNPELKREKTPPLSQAQQPETAVKPQDVVVSASEEPVNGKDKVVSDNNQSNSNDGVGNEKAKKVVKKKVKVVKKVIKRVPKKVVKPEIDSKSDQLDQVDGNVHSISNLDSTVSGGVEEENLKPASAQLKAENHDSMSGGVTSSISAGVVDDKELKPASASISDLLKAEIHDLILNRNSTVSAGVEDEESKSASNNVQLKAENHDLVCKEGEEESKVEVDKKDDVEQVQAENAEMKERELMEVDNVPNNVGGGEERGGECGKEGEGLGVGEGGKEEGMEGEEAADGRGQEAGEGKLFRGELEAMERRKRRKKEIFIGRLDKDIKEEDIKKVFAEVGKIVDLRLILNSKTGKKFAFLRYESAEEAKRALEKFAKVEICGKECGATPVEGNDTIFLGNIDKKWKHEDIVRLLNKIGIGKIDNVTVMTDPNNSKCNRGFAFVEFVTINDAQLAYTKLQERDAFGTGQKVNVAWAEPLKELDEEEMLKVQTVFAEFLPSSWDEGKLRDTFKKFGEIDDIVLSRNLQTSKRKDFAFISFKTREAAVKCIESFSHAISDEDGTKVNVKVSLAKPKPKRKNVPAAKPFAMNGPQAKPKASHSKVRPSEPRNWTQPSVPRYGMQIPEKSSTSWTQPSVPRYGIRIPEKSSTNVELVHLLREQASWRSQHASLSNSPMDIRYSNPLS
ncbi:hypothetical protein SOVF_201310, partial [Spinacia oleracea]